MDGKITLTRASLIRFSLHLIGVLAMSAMALDLIFFCMSFGIFNKDNPEDEIWLNICDVFFSILFFPLKFVSGKLFSGDRGLILPAVFWGIIGYVIAFIAFRIAKKILLKMAVGKRGEIIIGSIGFIGLLVYIISTFGSRFHFFDFLHLPVTGFAFVAVTFGMGFAILMGIIGFALASSLSSSRNKKFIVSIYFSPLIITLVAEGVFLIWLLTASF